jgi:hypothetical protein
MARSSGRVSRTWNSASCARSSGLSRSGQVHHHAVLEPRLEPAVLERVDAHGRARRAVGELGRAVDRQLLRDALLELG